MSGATSPTSKQRVYIKLETGLTMCVSPDLAAKLKRRSQAIDEDASQETVVHSQVESENISDASAIFGLRFKYGNDGYLPQDGSSENHSLSHRSAMGKVAPSIESRTLADESVRSAPSTSVCSRSVEKTIMLDKREKTLFNEREKPSPKNAGMRTQLASRKDQAVFSDSKCRSVVNETSDSDPRVTFSDSTWPKKKRGRLNSLKTAFLNKLRTGSPKGDDSTANTGDGKRKSVLRHSHSEESILDVYEQDSQKGNSSKHKKVKGNDSKPVLLNVNKLSDPISIPNGINDVPHSQTDPVSFTVLEPGPRLEIDGYSQQQCASPKDSDLIKLPRYLQNSLSRVESGSPGTTANSGVLSGGEDERTPSPSLNGFAPACVVPITCHSPTTVPSGRTPTSHSPTTVPSGRTRKKAVWEMGRSWSVDPVYMTSSHCDTSELTSTSFSQSHITNQPPYDNSLNKQIPVSPGPNSGNNVIDKSGNIKEHSTLPFRKWSLSTIVPILESRESIESTEDNLQEKESPTCNVDDTDVGKVGVEKEDVFGGESDLDDRTARVPDGHISAASPPTSFPGMMLMRQGSEISSTSSEGSLSRSPRHTRFAKQKSKTIRNELVLKSGVKKRLRESRSDCTGFFSNSDLTIPEVVISSVDDSDSHIKNNNSIEMDNNKISKYKSQDPPEPTYHRDNYMPGHRHVKYNFLDDVLVIDSKDDEDSLSVKLDSRRPSDPQVIENKSELSRNHLTEGWNNYVNNSALWGPSPDSPRTRKAWITHCNMDKSTGKTDQGQLCQSKNCSSGKPGSKVCHHGDCLDGNSGLPLILCTNCDTSAHSSVESDGHLRFNLVGSSNGVASGRVRHGSSHSLPEAGLLPETSTSDTELEISNRQDSGEDLVDGSDTIRNTKLQRKKVLKIRRHNTENQQKSPAKMMSVMHTRSRSYQEFSALDLSKALDQEDVTSSGPDLHQSSLYRGDSGVVMTSTSGSSSLDPKKRVFSVDSLPLKDSTPPGGAYVYSDKRNMPILESPSPGVASPLPGGGRASPNVFILPDTDTGSTSDPSFHSSTPVIGRSRRDGAGSHTKKAGPSPPHPFGRKHSVPVMLIGGSSSSRQAEGKLNLGAVECFKIHFDIVEELIKDQDMEIVPAIKGVTLREAVTSFMEKRGLTFDMVDFFIASSQSPLSVDTADCYFLAGADLHVKAKQSGEATLSRQGLASNKSTSSNRSTEKRPLHTKGSRSDLTQTETGSPHGTLKGAQPLKTFGKFFSSSRKPDQLQELLQTYKVQGLPAMPELLQLGHTKFDPTIFQLEASWTDLVSDPQSCDKYQQEAIWELLKTEVAYIHNLQFVIDLFLATLYNLQSHALLNDIETEKIFSNISDLHQANCQFYEKHMYTVVTTARETRQPLDPTPLIQGFLQFHTFFEPYSKFCIEYMGCQQYLTRMKEENELFRMYLNWTENNPGCNRLSLRDFIAKPFHRLTKYKLLLERIWKSAQRPDNVQEMISKVDQFICQVNATVTQLEIMRRIDSYDGVDLPNNDTLTKMVAPFCRLDLTRPIAGSSRTRFLIEEGNLRMNNRTDVICFLFTDMLLITKATSRKADINNKVKVKVYKPPMRLDKIFVNPLNDGGFMLVYLNEYNLATTAYTFHGDHAKQWLERIRQTQDEYEKLRNAIMDQSEAYLLNLANGYESFDDEYAYMNARSVAMDMGLDRVSVNRKISVSSADTFMGTMPEGGRGDMYRARSALSIPSRVTDTGRSPRDSPPAIPLVSSVSDNGATQSRFQSPQEHLAGGDGMAPGPGNKQLHLVARSHLHQSNSSPGTFTPESSTPHSQFVLPQRIGSDDIRKVKQRRDRRYFTADMIQDLHHKDSSIQKRLSWHSGAKDTDYEYKQGMGKSKTVSTDSLRSFHSSSGVSSVGSLHMNPDNEISEESSETNDWVVGDASSEDSSQASDTTTKTACVTSTSLEYPLTPPPDYPVSPPPDYPTTPPPITDTPTSKVNNALHVSFSADDSSGQNGSNLPLQNKVSKSMPDISSLSIVDEVDPDTRGRSSTVDTIREGQQRRKLSDSQSRRLKLQILNSTLEATDV